MSTDLPFFEAQVDALVNTIWWTLDEKFGRTTRPRVRSNPTTLTRTLDDFQQIWDSVAMRLSLAFFLPHFLKSFVEIENPYRVGMVLVLVCLIWPWVYSILIYTPFLDPLRKLPAPKGHWLIGLGFGVPNEDLGFFQANFANTIPPNSGSPGLCTYVALGCRRVIPYTPAAVSYFTNSRNYIKSEIQKNVIRRLTGDGILVVDNTEHKRQRKLLNPAFASEHIKNLIPSFWYKGTELCQLLETETVDAKEGYNMVKPLTRTTLDIIGLAGFGYDFGALKDETNPIAQAYFTIFDNSPETLLATLMMALYPILEHLPFSWIKRSDDAKQVIIEAASNLINSKLAEGDAAGDERDILGCMLQENYRLEKLGEEGLSKREMLYQILTFLAAGHETTSTAVAWALYELSEHPEIQVRLRSEIHSVLGKHYDPENPPTQSQLDRMTYLNNVCREVLRIDPPVPLTGRQAVDDDVYEGVHIPKDTMIHFPALVINMSHELWGPDAEEFRPERWESLKDVPNTQFLTFQHGPRACIGRKFAETEMRVLLAILIGSFEFKKVEGFHVEKYSLITMRPKNGLLLHVTRVE